MLKIEGGCLCGAIRDGCEAEPLMIVNCYCVACRKNSGSTKLYNIGVPQGSVRLRGKPKTYEDGSGASSTCSAAGADRTSLAAGPPNGGVVFIDAGTQDNPGPCTSGRTRRSAGASARGRHPGCQETEAGACP